MFGPTWTPDVPLDQIFTSWLWWQPTGGCTVRLESTRRLIEDDWHKNSELVLVELPGLPGLESSRDYYELGAQIGPLMKSFDALAKLAAKCKNGYPSESLIQGIVRHADRFGFLGLSPPALIEADEQVEPIDWWLSELWKYNRLREIMATIDRYAVSLSHSARREVEVALEVLPHEFHSGHPDVLDRSRWTIARCLTSQLQQLTTVIVTPPPEGGIRFIPKTPLGAVYLHLSIRFARGRTLRLCAHCKVAFSPRRRDQRFHDDGCRYKFHMARKREGAQR